jgi:transcriptional regulator GlxA family with amidase domain
MGRRREGSELPPVTAANDVEAKVGAPDPRITRALLAIRARLDAAWTVAQLARVAGLSRAAFARRFAHEVGEPPLRYLAGLRVRHAAERLRESDATLSELAYEVGYANEFALSRAFRRILGEPPAVHRRRARDAARGRGPRTVATLRLAA